MEIPSQSDFEDFIYKTQTPGFLITGYRRDQDFNLDLATTAIRSYRDGYKDFSFEVDLHPASIWLEKSSSASARAWASLFGKKHDNPGLHEYNPEDYTHAMYRAASRKRTPDDYKGRIPLYIDADEGVVYRELTPGEIEEKIALANTENEIQRRFNYRINAFLAFNPFDTSRGVASAFLGYFYTDAYKRHYVKAAERKAAAVALRDAIKTLGDERLWDLCGLQWSVRSPSRSRIDAIEKIISSDVRSPIRKLDGTVRERALAFELWSIFQRQFRANKVTAIFNFLLFDGVKNPPDSPRSIEKWVKEWKSAGVTTNPPQNWSTRRRM
ncbi:hypothetical protein [Xanthomonas sp. WHRI 7945]|nr:hypothetical protein [Xanthomonas campestris pv. campestris]